MAENPRFNRKKIWNYFWNLLLAAIILILLVPSWRVAFQGWFQSLFMREVAFQSELAENIPQEARNWALFDMNSTLHNFADFEGKPVILSFWATWCPPCRAELPELQELSLIFKDRINVVAVSEETIEIIENSGLHEDYGFLYSTPGIPPYYKVTAYPTLLIVDSNMKIVFRNEGAGRVNTEKNRQFLENLLN